MRIQTRFYYDIEDMYHFVILHQTKKILLEKDITRGYVHQKWVCNNFKKEINTLRLTPRSCFVEYLAESIDDIAEARHVYVK